MPINNPPFRTNNIPDYPVYYKILIIQSYNHEKSANTVVFARRLFRHSKAEMNNQTLQ